jgi:glutaminyl-peptide cyclotransferase
MRSSRFERSCRVVRRFGPLVLAAVLTVVGCRRGPDSTAFPSDAAWRYLVAQCDYGPRVPGTAAHDSTVRLISEVLAKNGAHVRRQRFAVPDPYGSDSLRLVNVIGRFGPDSGDRVILAAHFDSRPWADQETSAALRSRPVPGANDGASGVAVLLAMSDLFGARPPDRVGVELVFFDGEDYGREGDWDYYLLGSQHFAASLHEQKPRGAILLDMVGAKGAQIRQEGYSMDLAPRLTLELFERAKALGLDVFVPVRFSNMYDDHVPLLRAGIPSVDLIGFPYPYWHTTRDTPDKCSPETLRQVGTLIADFIDHPVF